MSFVFQVPRPAASLPAEVALPLPGGAVDLKLRRSARAQRLLLRVDPRDGRIELVLPAKGRLEDGLAFAQAQSEWIRHRLAGGPQRVSFVDGASIPLLGEAHRIVHQADRRGPPVEVAAACLYVRGEAGFVARRVTDYLRARARAELLPHVQAFSEALGRRHGRITLRDTATRWGSCAANGNMTFSWRLVLSPAAVLTYVAAHECAHLVELNHSARFWALVERLVPDCAQAKAWLRTHGTDLLRYG